jgi:hypothetical protein
MRCKLLLLGFVLLFIIVGCAPKTHFGPLLNSSRQRQPLPVPRDLKGQSIARKRSPGPKDWVNKRRRFIGFAALLRLWAFSPRPGAWQKRPNLVSLLQW